MREWLSDEGWPYPDDDKAVNDDVVVDLRDEPDVVVDLTNDPAYVFMAQQIAKPVRDEDDDDDDLQSYGSRFNLGG